ncbi:hypothetical protein [Pelomonas cellulosilytica]|uniref:PEP-CTERM protein-sorting domain-containing protein n=1 Tax=Pelomonas cellulosilytica TaxID=2906762 RepID=A0ABS8XWH3_9BURK|nr:hypothetical protein [Pelomonas sp. P8]MCE4555222.1 hypothetical protein [Pelomonas sp. P8]
MKHSFTILAAAAALAVAAPAHAVLTVDGSATPGSTTVGGSAFVTLTLNVSEDFTPSTLTFNLDWSTTGLALDPGISTALGQSWATIAAGFDPDPLVTFIDTNVPGHLGVSTSGTLPVLTAGSHTVKIGFTGVTAGEHAMTYELAFGAPGFAGPDFVVAGSSSVTVSAVPEANPAMMLAAGLAVIGLLARRRRA